MAEDTIIAVSDQEYYSTPELWGSSAYVSLKSIIDNILIGADDDSYFKNTDRFRAIIFGKLAVKKMNVDVKQSNKAYAIDLPPSRIWAYPRFMTNWHRISVVNDCGKLQELKINNNSTIQDYLQDHLYELLFDHDGEVLEGNPLNFERAKNGECSCVSIQCEENNTSDCDCSDDDFKDSWVKANEKGGYFEFSEDLIDRQIVFEFQTAGLDGLDDCDIMVHNDLEMTVRRYIEWNLLMGKRNVPKQEYITYKLEYKIEKRRSHAQLGKKISIGQILDAVSLQYHTNKTK